MIYKDLSYLRRSPYSKKILQALLKQNLTPLDLAHETGIDKSNVSKKLKELRKLNLVECLNPEDRKFRYYKITDYGKDVLKKTQ